MVLEKLKAAVNNRRIDICFKRGSCYFEQDEECVCLVIVQFRARDKRLEDVITNRILFHIPKIGVVGDKVDVCIELVHGPAVIRAHAFHIAVEEFLSDPGTEAAPKPDAVRCEDRVRLYIIDETRNQVAERVVSEPKIIVPRALHPVPVYRIEDQVREVLGVFLPNSEPQTKVVQRLFVALVG